MRKILFSAALLALLIPIPSLLYANETPEAKIEKLINTHGIRPLVDVLLTARGKAITIDVNGELRPSIGPPDDHFVSVRSILSDLRHAGLTVESFAALIPAAEEKAEAERSQRTRKIEVVERSVEAIEAEWKRDAEDRESQYEYRQREMEDTRKRVEKHDRAIAEANQAQAEAEAAWRQEMREEERLIIEVEKVKAMHRQTRELEGLEGDMRDQERAIKELQRDIQLRDLLSR